MKNLTKIIFAVFFSAVVFTSSSVANASDVAAGAKVVKKRCGACHTFNNGGKKRMGPNLWNVMGAKIGGVEGFKYSKSFKDAEGTWTDETLAEFLSNPRAYIKGSKMLFSGLKKEEDIANVIAYMHSLK